MERAVLSRVSKEIGFGSLIKVKENGCTRRFRVLMRNIKMHDRTGGHRNLVFIGTIVVKHRDLF